MTREPTADELAAVYVGALLAGAQRVPESVPAAVVDADLATIVEAVIGVAAIDGCAALERVADVLAHLGRLEEIGGPERLLYLATSWSDREERARELAHLLVRLRIVEDALREQSREEDATHHQIARLEAAREKTAAAVALLPMPSEAA